MSIQLKPSVGVMAAIWMFPPISIPYGYRTVLQSDGMSAVIFAYSRSLGFVIGADGRRRDPLSGNGIATRTAQKIFPVEREGISVAFAWVGVTTIVKPGNSGDFDFSKESRSIWETDLPEDGAESFVLGFINRFYERLIDSLGPEIDFKGVLPVGPMSRLLVVGEFKSHPYRAEVEINLEGTKVLRPALTESGYRLHHLEMFCMPRIIDRDNVFSAPHQSIGEGINRVKSCIEQASNNEEDGECKDVGGHIHIASITPDQGFRWEIPPITQGS